jgi:hypothetical protein
MKKRGYLHESGFEEAASLRGRRCYRAALGYAYYFFVGCSGGGCAITSNPYFSTGYGVVFGLLLALATAKIKQPVRVFSPRPARAIFSIHALILNKTML